MTKRKKELLRLYQRERARGFQAQWALSNARTRLEWDKHEVAEYSSGDAIDPKRGHVRLRIVPDEMCSLEDLEGDCFNSQANPDIPASRLQRDREDFIAKVNRDGVWGIIGEYFDGEAWKHADSCFGFVGDDWKNSGYDTDIMRTTLDEAEGGRHPRLPLLWPADRYENGGALMRDVSLNEPLTEKSCPVCGRGLARTYGPEIPCALCVRLGPPSVRCKQPRLK